MECIIKFTDESKSFAHGVEYGRLLEKMERGDTTVQNYAFPIRLENKKLIEDTCAHYGYIPTFGKIHFDEWIDFVAIKKVSTDN